ncbi:hypothetical protein LINPERHAP1_LOCUS5789, partial [Linum perenne]
MRDCSQLKKQGASKEDEASSLASMIFEASEDEDLLVVSALGNDNYTDTWTLDSACP